MWHQSKSKRMKHVLAFVCVVIVAPSIWAESEVILNQVTRDVIILSGETEDVRLKAFGDELGKEKDVNWQKSLADQLSTRTGFKRSDFLKSPSLYTRANENLSLLPDLLSESDFKRRFHRYIMKVGTIYFHIHSPMALSDSIDEALQKRIGGTYPAKDLATYIIAELSAFQKKHNPPK